MDTEPTAPQPNIGTTNKKRRINKLLAAMLIVVLAGAGIGAYFYIQRNSEPIPRSVSSQVNFPLLYPSSLPPKWVLDKSSINADPSAKIVSYVLQGPSGNLNITLQSAPKSFDFDNFYTKRLSGTIQFVTPLGQGAVGKAVGGSNQLVGSLVTPSTWVLASPSSSGVTQANIQFVLSNMRTVSP